MTSSSHPAALIAAFRARLASEELEDPRLKSLARWIGRLHDDRVADAIELVTIALDAPRRGRHEVSRLIEQELRGEEPRFPHADRVTFLRWVVRSRESSATIATTLNEIRSAKGAERARVLASLVEQGPQGATGAITNAHPILAYAWRSAPPDARPMHDAHFGEHEPFIGARGSVRAMIFLARRLRHLTARSQRRQHDELVRAAERWVETDDRSGLSEAAALRVEGALAVARAAAAEARAVARRPDMAGAASRPAAAKAITLQYEREGADAVKETLTALDHELRRLDVVHALSLKKVPPARILRAVYRGSDAPPGSRTLGSIWLAELPDRAFGVLIKRGSRWCWETGDRESVLASVPDAHFERAVSSAAR